MKKFQTLFIIVIAAIVLSACTVKKPPKNLQIQANGEFDDQTLTLNVKSSLPENAKLDLTIKDQNSKKTIYQTTLRTYEDGSADKKISLIVGKKNLEGLLLFKPEKQTKEIQEIYGEYGQNIRTNAYGYSKIKKNNESYVSIKLYGIFVKWGSMLQGGNLFFDENKPKNEKGSYTN